MQQSRRIQTTWTHDMSGKDQEVGTGAPQEYHRHGSAWEDIKEMQQECKENGEETGNEEIGMSSPKKELKEKQTRLEKERQERNEETANSEDCATSADDGILHQQMKW